MCIEFKEKSQANIVQIISITRLGEYQTILTNWTRNKIRNWNPPLLKYWFRLQSVRFICSLFHEEKKKKLIIFYMLPKHQEYRHYWILRGIENGKIKGTWKYWAREMGSCSSLKHELMAYWVRIVTPTVSCIQRPRLLLVNCPHWFWFPKSNVRKRAAPMLPNFGQSCRHTASRGLLPEAVQSLPEDHGCFIRTSASRTNNVPVSCSLPCDLNIKADLPSLDASGHQGGPGPAAQRAAASPGPTPGRGAAPSSPRSEH